MLTLLIIHPFITHISQMEMEEEKTLHESKNFSVVNTFQLHQT